MRRFSLLLCSPGPLPVARRPCRGQGRFAHAVEIAQGTGPFHVIKVTVWVHGLGGIAVYIEQIRWNPTGD